ncbi:MAG: imidazole glycerol phosphate synthase subunit HisF [Magnetococcales bacterium]|nr:imidazole glycerol phosphate synthase subunit HisF [Magnetococcales bacterium]MBF0156347.1 imidazole glycerol phosphate synthase subunit HisF [Magnetococcales bacterium]
MENVRLIARLDIKAPNLVKGVQLEGLRKLGSPNDFAREYYRQGIDEILYMDIVASLYERNSILSLVEAATAEVFVPITVGGGIRSVFDVAKALRAGADKVAINTAAIKRPELLTEIARHFGSQCMVLSIEAKSTTPGRWEAYFDNGREHTGKDAVAWAREGEALGAGEILLTSVDHEGMAAGMDIALIRAVREAVTIPVIASGGVGSVDHLEAAVRKGGVRAVAMAHTLHYRHQSVGEIRAEAIRRGLNVRQVA